MIGIISVEYVLNYSKFLQIKNTLIPVPKASHSITQDLVKSGSANTGVEHMACLRAINSCCASSF